MGRFRARFILQALNELKNKIESLGGQIEFLFGRASEEIAKLVLNMVPGTVLPSGRMHGRRVRKNGNWQKSASSS